MNTTTPTSLDTATILELLYTAKIFLGAITIVWIALALVAIAVTIYSAKLDKRLARKHRLYNRSI